MWMSDTAQNQQFWKLSAISDLMIWQPTGLIMYDKRLEQLRLSHSAPKALHLLLYALGVNYVIT